MIHRSMYGRLSCRRIRTEPKSVSIDKDMQIVFFDYDIIPAAVEVIDRDRENGVTLE